MKKKELEKVLDNDSSSHQMKQAAFKYLTERFGEKDNIYHSHLNNRLYIVDTESDRNFKVRDVYGEIDKKGKRDEMFWVGKDGKKRKSFINQFIPTKKERKSNLKHSGRKIENIENKSKYKSRPKKNKK